MRHFRQLAPPRRGVTRLGEIPGDALRFVKTTGGRHVVTKRAVFAYHDATTYFARREFYAARAAYESRGVRPPASAFVSRGESYIIRGLIRTGCRAFEAIGLRVPVELLVSYGDGCVARGDLGTACEAYEAARDDRRLRELASRYQERGNHFAARDVLSMLSEGSDVVT